LSKTGQGQEQYENKTETFHMIMKIRISF